MLQFVSSLLALLFFMSGPVLKGNVEIRQSPFAAENGLIGVTSGESSALARQIYGIEVNGQPAVSSIEAFGSRAGSTFSGIGVVLKHLTFYDWK